MEQLATADGAHNCRARRQRARSFHSAFAADRSRRVPSRLPDLMRRFRVTLVNLPGFHGTRNIPGALIAYETWLANALDGFGIGSDCILCGNGFGGTVALAFALNQPRQSASFFWPTSRRAFPNKVKQRSG